MRKYWFRFLYWLYGDFISDVVKRIVMEAASRLKEYNGFQFEHIKSELEGNSSRVIHIVSERCAYLEEQNQQLRLRDDEHSKSFEEFRQQIEARFAQVMALWYGKTPQDWSKPLPRAPKDFNYEDRQ
jgi:hypothetical protein